MAKGRGAPLDLRLFIAALLLTPIDARTSRRRLAVTVRELRDFLFPHGWERRRDWLRVREALWKARDYTIPDGRGPWLPFALRRDPGADAALDDLVLIDAPAKRGDRPPDRSTRPRTIGRGIRPEVPRSDRRAIRRMGAGYDPPTRSRLPALGLVPRRLRLSDPDGRGPGPAGVRRGFRHNPESESQRERRALGGPAGPRDRRAVGRPAGRKGRLADPSRPRSGRGQPGERRPT